MADNNNLLLLFDRPREPSFLPKNNEGTSFEVPTNFLTDRFKPLPQVVNRFGEGDKLKVKGDISLPDLSKVTVLQRDENFSLFIPKHQKIAGELINIFLAAPDRESLKALGLYTKDRVNPYLYVYALSVAILHRPDTQNMTPPNLATMFPDKYFQSSTFTPVEEEAFVVNSGSRTPIEIPVDYTASNLDIEHRIAYFREDLGVNLHHWHWHLVYPTNGPVNIVRKDRRGELFYYAHNQIVARYNFERLCNDMKRVERLTDMKGPIKEAYFPKLDSRVASRSYPARVADQVMKDINRTQDEITLDVDALIRWRDRIYGAIHTGAITGRNGETIPLTEESGIDILGNLLESSVLSQNPDFYGNYHAMGHVFLSFIHDPDHRHLENFGVVGDFATAMRDPVFYRWHAHIEDIFQEHKATLPRYTVANLNYPGITVDAVQIQSNKNPVNTLNTFWQQSDIDLSRGMDFQPRGAVFVRATHLQHQPFTYNIKVNNATGAPKNGTCRIFMAPKFDERGNPWLFRDQKSMFIEMDKFNVNLKAGQNTIMRTSDQSTVTIPYETTYRDLDTNRPTGGDALAQFNFCNCGWPQNLLVPKGNASGFACQFFVMVSDYELDKIPGQDSSSGVCNDAPAFCGLKDKKYPDRRSMGYPFDRMPRDGVDRLSQFLTPNMRVQDCVIQFNDRTVRRRT